MQPGYIHLQKLESAYHIGDSKHMQLHFHYWLLRKYVKFLPIQSVFYFGP